MCFCFEGRKNNTSTCSGGFWFLSRWFYREINVHDGWMEDGVCTNTKQENGLRCTRAAARSPCLSMHVGTCMSGHLCNRLSFRGLPKLQGSVGRHSPLLHQQDGDQHQQYEDQSGGTDASDLHHSVRLLSGVGNDFGLLGGTYETERQKNIRQDLF